uniref:hypothetical protein n=1 Tax=Roseomonas chloroacetimidivorans TaxID=1766656 RepID=UPI003C77161A
MTGQGYESEDGAERAFEALRAEVAGLRRQVETLRAPDYDASLGALAREVRGLGGRLQQAIEVARPFQLPTSLGVSCVERSGHDSLSCSASVVARFGSCHVFRARPDL